MPFAAIVLTFFCEFAFAGSGITYQGRILKPNGAPIEGSVVQFKLQVRSPGTENCLMYEETHSRDMTGSNGMFAITINDGTASTVNTEPFSLDRVFQNRGTFSFGGGKCTVGNTYAPNPADGRKLVVAFSDVSEFAGFESLPAQAINFVPMSLESLTVGGYGSGSMLRVNDGTGAPASISALTQTQYNTFTDLLAGTSPLYLTSSSSLNGANLSAGSIDDTKIASGITGSKISGNISGNAAGFTGSLNGDVTGTQSATVVAKIQGRAVDSAAPTNGQVLKWNNGNSRWEPSTISVGGGTVTSVTGAGSVVMTGTATDPIVGVQDASTSAKGVVQLAASGAATAGSVVEATDSRLSDSRAPTAHTHVVDQITSASGKYFSYLPNNVACANGELLKWNLAQTRWECGVASSSESTTVSNIGTAGVGVYKQLTGSNIELKKINPASSAVTVVDNTGANQVDIGVNAELAGLGGLSANGYVKRTAAGTYSATSAMGVADLDFAGSMAVNTGLVVRNGTQFYNKTCSGNETLIWSVSNGWSCNAVVLSESDPKVGANTTNALSKWNGSALVASGVFENSGSVGIGTTTPTDVVDVRVANSKNGLRIVDTTTGNGIQLQAYYPGFNFNTYWDGSNQRAIGPDYTGIINMDPTTGNLNFYTGNNPGSGAVNTINQRIIIKNNGNIGLGTNSAPWHLTVRNQAADTGIALFQTNDFVSGTTGSSMRMQFGAASGNTYSQIDATSAGNSVYNNLVLQGGGGNVGIGTTSPTSKLEVVGQTRSVSAGGGPQINSSAAVDWNNGNAQSMSVACTSTAFTNMLDGGTYVLAVSETGTTTCVFAQSGLTFYYSPANGPRTNGQRSVYTFQRIGTDVYVSWVAGFQ